MCVLLPLAHLATMNLETFEEQEAFNVEMERIEQRRQMKIARINAICLEFMKAFFQAWKYGPMNWETFERIAEEQEAFNLEMERIEHRRQMKIARINAICLEFMKAFFQAWKYCPIHVVSRIVLRIPAEGRYAYLPIEEIPDTDSDGWT